MRKDAVDLICNIGELASLFQGAGNLDQFLQRVVSTVAWHMKAAVCSVYLFEEATQELVLRATQGLNPELLGRVRLKLGEGITGTAVKELRAIWEARGSANPRFKFIPGSFEERYEAFLAVPILKGLVRVGALVVQDPQPDYFDGNDAKALRAIAAQLASAIDNAQLLMSLHAIQTRPDSLPEGLSPAPPTSFMVRGRRASNGVAQGTACVDAFRESAPERSSEPMSGDDFQRALDATIEQLQGLQTEMEERLLDVGSLIFSAHLLMLKDDGFSGEMARRIDGGAPPRQAIADVVDEYSKLFEGSRNPRLREKVQDVKDLGRRLFVNLSSDSEHASDYTGRIIVASELLPSDLVKLSAQHAAGVILRGGGIAAHIAILARSLQLPMITVADESLPRVAEGTPLLVDADQGAVFVNPTPEVLDRYRELEEAHRQAAESENAVRPRTLTADGQTVRLLASVNLLSDLPVARRLQAEGVGLYRSEFPFIVRNDFPSEEEQYRIYRRVVEAMEGRPVTFRTLDAGGDKALSYFPRVNESNPFLGLRAIRFSLRNRDVFAQQLRAMLRAGHEADTRIMFPLVASVDDFLDARQVVRECAEALAVEGIPHDPNPPLGVMIEVPSAVEIAADLALEADFFSIGSNDLVQYILAVDRTNEHISDLFLSHHPAVVRALKRVVEAAASRGREVSICGGMAADPRMLPYLIGIGIRSFSLDPRLLPKVQPMIEGLSAAKAARIADEMLGISTVRGMNEYLEELELFE